MRVDVTKMDMDIFKDYYESENDIYYKILSTIIANKNKSVDFLTRKNVQTIVKQLQDDSNGSAKFKKTIKKWQKVLRNNYYLMESSDFQDDLKEVFHNIVEIGFAEVGYPTAKLMTSNKWEKSFKNNFNEILNHTFESDEDIDGYRSTGVDWEDVLPDGVLFASPDDIDYFAELISDKLLNEGLYLINIYLYFFTLLIIKAKYNRVPIEKMFKKVKDNLLEEFKKIKPKEFFEIISIL